MVWHIVHIQNIHLSRKGCILLFCCILLSRLFDVLQLILDTAKCLHTYMKMEIDLMTKEYTITQSSSLPADMTDDSCRCQFTDRALLTNITDGLSTSACLNRNRSSVAREDTVSEVTFGVDDHDECISCII